MEKNIFKNHSVSLSYGKNCIKNISVSFIRWTMKTTLTISLRRMASFLRQATVSRKSLEKVNKGVR